MGMELNSTESITKPDNSRVLYQTITKAEYGAIERADMTLLPEPGVYCIFNTASNRCYIGCSVNVYLRIQTHKRQISSGTHICRGMVDDYAKNPDAFRFFCIQHTSESDYEVYESFRMGLLLLESQHIKRVPLGMLYNSVVPASLSEKLLRAEQKRQEKPVKITEIIARLQMSEDSIRSNGFSNTSILSLNEAIEFVQKRTFPSGRWPAEKAILAKEYLAELNTLLPSGDDVEGLLMRGGVMDYFSDPSQEFQKVEDIPKVKIALKWAAMKAAHVERSKRPPTVVKKTLKWPLWAAFFITAGSSVPNMYAINESVNGGGLAAISMTFAFSVTPFFILMSGLKGVGPFISVVGTMLYTAFCNAMAIFGVLTAMNHSYILSPSVFLEAVTNFMNTDYMSTARFLSCAMAVVIGGIEYISIKNIAK